MAADEVDLRIPPSTSERRSNSARQTLSVVTPAYNEAASIRAFYDRTRAVLEKLSAERGIDYELIFVDDGSSDGTADELQKFAADNDKVGVVTFSRNFGHQIAITAGIDFASGDAVAVIDSDLQDPPEVLAEMVELWRDGWDVVYGQRTARPGESRFKLLTARFFYRVINWMSDVELPVDAGDFRLMDRQVVDVLKRIQEENRYMRGLVAWVGFRQTPLAYKRDERYAGETKYPLRKMLRFATDGIASFSNKPLRLVAELGGIVTIISFIAAFWIIGGKIINPSSQLPGYASLMTIVLFLGGMQLLCVGILGQYLGRTYQETKRRPLYVVSDMVQVTAPTTAQRTSVASRAN